MATIQRRTRTGELIRLRRGWYSDEPLPESASDRHRRWLHAVLPTLSGDAVASHLSAAVLHGLPVWQGALTHVTVTRPGESGGYRSQHVDVHRAPLDDADVTYVDGLPVTSLLRTVCDIGRSAPFEQAVAAADAALRMGLDRETVLAQAAAHCGRTGVGQLRHVLEFADARAESAGESFSRVVMDRVGLPTPVLQATIRHSRTDEYLGRVDFLWKEYRLIGECDGRVKYDGTFGRSGAEVIMEEKAREAALRDDGWQVLRWVWANLKNPEHFRGRWMRAAGLG